MTQVLKPNRFLHQDIAEFIEALHKGCSGETSTGPLESQEFTTCSQAASTKPPKTDSSIISKTEYDKKTCSLKPGQKLCSRPDLDIKQILKPSNRLTK